MPSCPPNSCESEQPALLVFADDWGRHPSSCQHLIRRLRERHRILWVNTIGTRSAGVNGFTLRRGWEKIRNWGRGLQQVADQMWVVDAPMLPTVGGRVSRALNQRLVNSYVRLLLKRLNVPRPIVLTTLPHTIWLVGDVGQSAFVYYCTDDFSQWPDAERDALLAAEQKTQDSADLVLAASRRLLERHSRASRCEYFPHAVDFDHFSRAASASVHERLQSIPGPRIGFFGLIYEKLNFELLKSIATQIPEASLVMLGPVVHCPEELEVLPNVHLVGRQPYEELPHWIAGFDVLLLPYVNDEMIRQSSPLKLRECLASGKPTVCVELPEARLFEPHVRVAGTAEEYVAAVRESLQLSRDAATMHARQQAVRNETWDTRAEQLEQFIHGLSL